MALFPIVVLCLKINHTVNRSWNQLLNVEAFPVTHGVYRTVLGVAEELILRKDDSIVKYDPSKSWILSPLFVDTVFTCKSVPCIKPVVDTIYPQSNKFLADVKI